MIHDFGDAVQQKEELQQKLVVAAKQEDELQQKLDAAAKQVSSV